jgi:hypothetical protein
MKEVMKALLMDPTLRNAEDVERIAVAQGEFLAWQ